MKKQNVRMKTEIYPGMILRHIRSGRTVIVRSKYAGPHIRVHVMGEKRSSVELITYSDFIHQYRVMAVISDVEVEPTIGSVWFHWQSGAEMYVTKITGSTFQLCPIDVKSTSNKYEEWSQDEFTRASAYVCIESNIRRTTE